MTVRDHTYSQTYDAPLSAIAEALYERQRASGQLVEDMVTRALDGVEISAQSRFLLFSTLRHWLVWEAAREDVRKLEAP